MGEVFAGRYELIDLIGEGAMGTVWRVHDRRHDTIVAAKVLRQSDAGALLRFMREQGMRIHHPHVVTPIGWAGEDDKVLFTMPAVEGGSLADLLRRCGPLPAAYTAELLRQLLSALDAVHDAGVIHRDIKPGNLLLEPTGTDRPFVRLTDFGVAMAVDAPRMTTRAMVLGTPGFIAPELMYGGDPSPHTDLYAAGVVGMQTLTGVRAGTGVRTSSTDVPPRLEDVPDALWQVLVGLLDPDPTGRPESAGQALSRLEVSEVAWRRQTEVAVNRLLLPPAAAGEFSASELEATIYDNAEGGTARLTPVVTRKQQQPERSAARQRPHRDGKALVTLVATALIAVAALGGVWLFPRGDSRDGPAGTANVNGICRWQDAGTMENSSDGKALACRSEAQGYRWVDAG